jgi:hypothetical protein
MQARRSSSDCDDCNARFAALQPHGGPAAAAVLRSTNMILLCADSRLFSKFACFTPADLPVCVTSVGFTMIVAGYLVLVLGFIILALCRAHTQAHGGLNLLACNLIGFLVVNTLICFWELALCYKYKHIHGVVAQREKDGKVRD